MGRHVHLLATIVVAECALASVALAQKESAATISSALRPIPTALANEHRAAIAIAQPAVRAWVTEQAVRLRRATSFATGASTLGSATRKRFALTAADSSTLQAILVLTFVEALHELQKEKAEMLAKLASHNAAAEAISDALDALVEASQELSEKERDCTSPLCVKFKEQYARVLAVRNVPVVATLATADMRTANDALARRQQLLDAAAKVKADNDAIAAGMREARERYEQAMAAATASFNAAQVAAASTVAGAAAGLKADTTLPLISRLVVRLK